MRFSLRSGDAHRSPSLFRTLLVAVTFAVLLAGCGGGGDNKFLIMGETQSVSGVTVSAWSRVVGDAVVEAGATVPFALIQNPPAEGDGPAGAFAMVAFPAITRNTTFLNHFEMQWEPNGHPPAFTMVPHFDLHFYAITPEEVLRVKSPDPAAPVADRIPTDYVYPGVNSVVPEMGVHARNPAEYQGEFTKVFIVGYYGGRMTFLEPAVNRTYLLTKASYSIAVPRPAVLGRATRYPTKFTATYDSGSDSYTFVFSDFVSVQ